MGWGVPKLNPAFPLYFPTTFPSSNAGSILPIKVPDSSGCWWRPPGNKRWTSWLTSDQLVVSKESIPQQQWTSFRIYRNNLNTCPYLSKNRTPLTTCLGTALRSLRGFGGWGPQPTEIPPRCSLRTDVSCRVRPEKLHLAQHSTGMTKRYHKLEPFFQDTVLSFGHVWIYSGSRVL